MRKSLKKTSSFIYEVKTTGRPNGDIELPDVCEFFVCKLDADYLREQLLAIKVQFEDTGRHRLILRLMRFAMLWGMRGNSIVLCPAFVIDAENQIQRFTNRLQDFCNDDRLSGRPIILNFVQIKNVRCVLEKCYDRLVQPRL